MKSPTLEALVGRRNARSPFTKLIALGYYDGPTDGYILSNIDSRVYEFSKLDWDDRQDIRIFSMAEVHDTDFDELTRTLAMKEEPKWPIWVPASPLHQEAERLMQEMQARTDTPAWIIASMNLLNVILVCKEIDYKSFDTDFDWLGWLGFSR